MLSACLFSCQKEVEEGLPEPPEAIVSSENPSALSTAIRVWHGTRVQGTMPSPNSVLPALDPTINLSIEAFAGRFAIIKPTVLDGEIAGYYIGINGSGQYFNVDFTRPRDIAGRQHKQNAGRLFSPQDGNADSSIVIVLPPNIQVPDTFCVSYSAYDANGNVGPVITTCIYVSVVGGDSESAWLQNDWKITSQFEIENNQVTNLDTMVYNQWENFSSNGYICDPNSPVGGPALIYNDPALGIPALVSDSIYLKKYNLSFATNGSFEYNLNFDERAVSITNSTCASPVFNSYSESDSLFGGWAYNSTTGRILLIFEFDYTGTPQLEVWDYELIKISTHQFLIKYGNEYIRLER